MHHSNRSLGFCLSTLILLWMVPAGGAALPQEAPPLPGPGSVEHASPELEPEPESGDRETRRGGRRSRRARSGSPGGARPRQEDPRYVARLAPYAAIVSGAGQHTVRMLVEGQAVALATVVDEDLLLTKASEIRDREFRVDLGEAGRCDGEVVHDFGDHDLALVRVPVRGLRAVQWHSSRDLVPGSFVAAADGEGHPVAVGIVSAPERSLSEDNRGYLGVQLAESEDEIGVLVSRVVERTPADRAGLRAGDLVLALDDAPCASPSQLIRLIASRVPGDVVRVLVRRDEREQLFQVRLTSRGSMLASRREADSDNVSNAGTELSTLRSGYPRALQHDCAIRPEDCGGPLIDLDGHVIGINIARASRVSSYALTSDLILELLGQWRGSPEAALR